jgi:beta-lactamase superfamily II metal-dependent hydrolase
VLTFHFFDAKHGDAFLVEWGSPAGSAMLVDGGPTGTYEAGLRSALLHTLPRDAQGRPRIDVVCLSHIDDDHAAGLVRLFAEIRRARRDSLADPFSVARLWFNSVEELVDRAEPGLSAGVAALFRQAQASEVIAASYNQGRQLRDDAAVLALDGNQPFAGPLIRGGHATIADLHVTVVAPDTKALDKLARKWREARNRADPAVITAAYSDQSVPNLSSIVLFVEHAGRTALLTGDARGDRVLAGLAETGLLHDGDPLRVDLLKVPHHGSNRNLERSFFDRVQADHYVISADGVKHHHPSEETLHALVGSRDAADRYAIHFTNEIPFALRALEPLRASRAFGVIVRPPESNAVSVVL